MKLKKRKSSKRVFRWKVLVISNGEIISKHTKRKYARIKANEYIKKHNLHPLSVLPVFIPNISLPTFYNKRNKTIEDF